MILTLTWGGSGLHCPPPHMIFAQHFCDSAFSVVSLVFSIPKNFHPLGGGGVRPQGDLCLPGPLVYVQYAPSCCCSKCCNGDFNSAISLINLHTMILYRSASSAYRTVKNITVLSSLSYVRLYGTNVLPYDIY